MGDISKDFSLSEMIHSDTADKLNIDNTPSKSGIIKLKALVINVLQPMRYFINDTIIVTSGYRCPLLNKSVNGAKNSQHTKYQAADIVCDELEKLFNWAKDNLDFDQLIFEHHNGKYWIHVSYVSALKNRNQVLMFENGVYKNV